MPEMPRSLRRKYDAAIARQLEGILAQLDVAPGTPDDGEDIWRLRQRVDLMADMVDRFTAPAPQKVLKL